MQETTESTNIEKLDWLQISHKLRAQYYRPSKVYLRPHSRVTLKKKFLI